jgi:hypothetical protein
MFVSGAGLERMTLTDDLIGMLSSETKNETRLRLLRTVMDVNIELKKILLWENLTLRLFASDH